MLNKIKQFLKRLFKKDKPLKSQPKVRIGDKVGNVIIKSQYQLDKHTDFKVGESYRVGEMIVTLRSSKEEVQAIIASMDAKRAAKERAMKERGIELMLMSPEEIKALKLEEWLEKRSKKGKKIDRIIGAPQARTAIKEIWTKASKMGYKLPEGYNELLISLKDKEVLSRFEELTKDAFQYTIEKEKEEELVK